MKHVIFVVSMLGIAGCATQKAAVVPPPAEPARAAAPAPAPAPTPVAAEQKQLDLEALLKGMVIHFGFDVAELTPDSRTRLDGLAEALQAHPKAHIRIAGNCDELGTAEYNLALGQKRADSVARYLVNLGIARDRVDTVSYGEEKPVDSRGTEEAHGANRRADMEPKQK